jgi:hypothetical protein
MKTLIRHSAALAAILMATGLVLAQQTPPPDPGDDAKGEAAKDTPKKVKKHTLKTDNASIEMTDDGQSGNLNLNSGGAGGGGIGGFGGGGGMSGGSFGGGGVGSGFGGGGTFSANAQGFAFDSEGTKAHTLIVRSGNIGASKIAALEEDLPVMSRIFDKALEKNAGDDEPMSAMNIPIFTFGGAQKFRSFYLDGYGVLFLQQVPFPLAEPPKEATEKQTKAAPDSTWERTKRELYGSPDSGNVLLGQPQPAEAYDAEKVSHAKEALLEALKNAANIRELRPEEYITLVVTTSRGGRSGRFFSVGNKISNGQRNVVIRGGPKGATLNVLGDEPRPGSMLTIRVRKSDVDAYAKGKLSSEEFRQKAELSID